MASYEELPSIYAYAKCFILASKSETWGLVVNEAAATGLPLIISQNCGCVPDMCLDGINGFTFRSGNVDQLAYHMLNISAGEVDLDEFGCMSQRLVARWTPENWAEALVDCTDTVLNHGGSNHHL
jgi:glycosyltransferase involved in cell wall biosynthesis